MRYNRKLCNKYVFLASFYSEGYALIIHKLRQSLKKIRKRIGELIAQRRTELGYKTQAEFAEALETDQSKISRWENGVNLPEGKSLQKVCEALQISEDYFDKAIEAPPLNAQAIYEYIRDMEAQIGDGKLDYAKRLSAESHSRMAPSDKINRK